MLLSCEIFVFCQKKKSIYSKCFSCFFKQRSGSSLWYYGMADFLIVIFWYAGYGSPFVSGVYIMAYLIRLEARELE